MVCQVCQVVVCGKVRYGDPWAVVRPLGQADSARAWTSWRAGQGEAGRGRAGLGWAGQDNRSGVTGHRDRDNSRSRARQV